MQFIEKHEGYSGTVYKDSAGNPTIGYGHLIKEGEDFSKGITKEKAGRVAKRLRYDGGVPGPFRFLERAGMLLFLREILLPNSLTVIVGR